jgi:hypothetical protein
VLHNVEHQHAVEVVVGEGQRLGVGLADAGVDGRRWLRRRHAAFGSDALRFGSDYVPAHLCGHGSVVHAVGLDAQAHAVAQDFAAAAAHVEHAHPRPHVGQGEGVAQPAREVRPL